MKQVLLYLLNRSDDFFNGMYIRFCGFPDSGLSYVAVNGSEINLTQDAFR